MNQLFVNIINNFHIMNNMKNKNHVPNLSSKEVSVHQLNANQTVETIQNISKNVRGYALQMRQTMKTLRESGAIPEFALAIREGSFAVRDTVKDLNETTQELKQNGVIRDTASAVENTFKTAEESLEAVKEISNDASQASPSTSKAVKEGFETLRKETTQASGKVVEGIKNKVGA